MKRVIEENEESNKKMKCDDDKEDEGNYSEKCC